MGTRVVHVIMPRRHRVVALHEGSIDRIGIGTDIHRLEPGSGLRLGGVEIPFDRRLAGHSDGDVVLHAVTDAILGAAGLPDIGERYPDTDPRYQGADSRLFLREAVGAVAVRGYRVMNADITIHAERPKLSPHKAVIQDCVAGLLGVSSGCVSVKAKTNEGFDAVGRGDAIACTVVLGLSRILTV